MPVPVATCNCSLPSASRGHRFPHCFCLHALFLLLIQTGFVVVLVPSSLPEIHFLCCPWGSDVQHRAVVSRVSRRRCPSAALGLPQLPRRPSPLLSSLVLSSQLFGTGILSEQYFGEFCSCHKLPSKRWWSSLGRKEMVVFLLFNGKSFFSLTSAVNGWIWVV